MALQLEQALKGINVKVYKTNAHRLNKVIKILGVDVVKLKCSINLVLTLDQT